MELSELPNNPDALKAIQAFVNSPMFIYIKDAFCSHTPEGDKGNAISIETHHGMNMGTRFVFNRLSEISKSKPPKQKAPRPAGQDPDLAGED